MDLPSTIELRPLTTDDEEFLLELYASTRADELALTGWDEARRRAFIEMQFAAQQHYYRTQFPEGEHSILTVEGRPAGRLYIARRDDEIRILDIIIADSFKNRGLGSSILKGLIAEAKESRACVRVYVEQINRSLRLFERLGFTSAQTTHSHFLMEWRGEGGPPEE